jgi:ketosteroid isomerase-like protein
VQHYSISQQNPLTARNLDSVLVPDRPAPDLRWPAIYLAPARQLPVQAAVSAASYEASDQAVDDDVVVDLRVVQEIEVAAAAWRTVHVVDVENLIGEDHRDATVEQIRAVIEDYRQLVGARDGDLFFFGANPELKFRVMVATGSNQVRGYKGKDGADKALLDVVNGDWVVGQFDRVCVASGDHAFAPLARSLKGEGLHVTVVSRPMSVSAELYRAASEHLVLDQGQAAA